MFRGSGGGDPSTQKKLQSKFKPNSIKIIKNNRGVVRDGDTRGESAWCHPLCVTHCF